ncbi:G-protein coupled receptor GRL101 isoform X1 [Penaeus vannamei]|uniref:G-protein coupled receptor GRL101 isoform X1 n=1 Tax=Penaeus vannamei TaxID=6689 RepID=UPI00387F9F6E
MAGLALSLLVAVVALTTSSALLPHDAAEQQRGLSKILQRSDRGQLVRATALDALREAQEAGERRAGGIASTFVRDGEEGEKDGWPIFYKGNKEKRKDRQASTGNNKNKKQGTKKKKKKKKKRNKKKMMSMKKEIEAKLLPTTSLRKIYWEPEPLRRTWEAEESVDPVRVSCRDDEWACVDGSMCVPKNVTCSGVAECQDNSDEAVALCGCLPNEYNCGDQCIDALSRCDTVQDCDNGRDEHNCETYVCPSTHTKCANSLCIPLDAVCNLEDDCGDGSDEQECPYRTCYYLEFVCANGECVRPGRVCDGAPDCVDESDEANCTAADFAVCGNGKRVHRHWWCDGWTDCEDNHADELDCGPCNDRQYSCSDGQCISAGNVCDSQCDCVDCGDEIDCEEFYTVNSGVPECHKGVALTCVVSPLDRKKDRCIAARNICDGFNDCHNGEQVSDEYGCLNESADCALLEDQEDSLFPCSDGRCLPVHLRCDGKRDCLRGEDEDLCREAVCGRGEWRCGGGQCIPEASRCDLVLDCEDRTDEMNCGYTQGHFSIISYSKIVQKTLSQYKHSLGEQG